MAAWDAIVKKAKAQLAPAVKQAKDRAAINTYGQGMGSGVNSSYTATYRPDILNVVQQKNAAGVRDQYGNPLTYGGGLDAYLPRGGAAQPPPQTQVPRGPGAGTGGGGGGGRGGGGGNAAALAQTQLDALLAMLGSQTWKAAPMTSVRDQIAGRQTGVNEGYNKDYATAEGAYGNLDTFLGGLGNAYRGLQFQPAQVANQGNPWLASQGVQGVTPQATNPDDAYGGFQNVAQLLAAGQDMWNQSARTGSGQARASTLSGLGAARNAYNDQIQQQLAQVAQQEYAAQQALDNQRREAYLSAVLPLLGAGATAPADVMAQMGWA
jgi:hypothetical protein